MLLHIGRDFDSAEEGLDIYRESLGDVLSVHDWSPLDGWGPHVSQALRGKGTLSGSTYEIRIYALADDDRTLLVQELSESSAAEKMEPGMQLIRRSFRWK